MFGNEDDLKNSIPNSMRVTIIHPTPQKNDLSQRILDKTELSLKERLKFNCISNYKDIYKDLDKPFQQDQESSKGLINRKWIDDICNRRPALIIYFYHIPNGANKSLEEKKMYESLQEIKKNDDLVNIFLFIICKDMRENPYDFKADDPQKTYGLRSVIQKDFIFIFDNDDICKLIDLDSFCKNIIHYSRLYYRRYKTKIKEKKMKATSREEKIEYDIMLGVLSIIKTKKIAYNKNKYLDEAYTLISDKSFNKSKYLYGNKSINPKFNLIEVRAVSDWLFFKRMKLQNTKISVPNKTATSTKNLSKSLTTSLLGRQPQQQPNVSEFDLQIQKYQNHIQNFSYLYEFIKKDSNDKFIFIEYYWLIERYKDLCELYEENLKKNKSKKKMLYLVKIYFNQIFSYIKMIKFFNSNKINNLNIALVNNKEIALNKIETALSLFYGKPPSYSYKDIHNPLVKFELGFDEDIYFKKFVIEKKLNVEGALNESYNEYLSKTTNLLKNLKSLGNNSNNFEGGIDLYFNMLKILLLNNNDNKEINAFRNSNLTMNDNLFSILNSFPNLYLNNIKKFPKIYSHYLELNINSLMYHMQSPDITNYDKTKLFINLSLLGNLRKLNENEESTFFQLLNDENFVPVDKSAGDSSTQTGEPKQIVIKLNEGKNNENGIFNFDYNLKNGENCHEKKILDLVEYNFKIRTSLSKENIKLNSVKIYFQCVNEDTNIINEKKYKREIIIREYKKDELENFDLNNNSSIDLEHKLFMKYKKGKIHLSQVEFTLCKKENIIYKIELQSDINKMIFITNLSKKVLNINVPKEKFTVGVNQLNKFEVEVKKEELDEVHITQFKMSFMAIPSYYKKTVPNTSMKALLSTKTTPTTTPMKLFANTNTNTQANLSQQIFGLPKSDKKNIKPDKTMSIIPPERSSVPNAEYQVNNNINSNLKARNTITANQSSMQNFFYKTPNEKQTASNQNTGSNNFYKSQMFPSSTVSVSSTQSQTPISSASTLPSEKIQVALPSPEFYFYNEENNNLDKNEKSFEKEYNNFESLLKNKNKFGVLIKFLQAGQYEIKLNINYSIRHRDIEDYFEFNQEETLRFIVIEPFKFCNEVNSNNFLTITKIKEDKTEARVTEFLTNKNIQLNLILTNQLNEDLIIKDIIIQLDQDKLTEKNKDIEVKSSIKDIIDSKTLPVEVKNQILKIIKTADYSIPFETIFNDKFQGSIGKIILKWSTPSLMEYQCGDLSLTNENYFDFPYIVINQSNLNYEYDTKVNENKDVLFNIKVANVSEQCRKVIFMIENGDDINFIVSGLTKQIHSIEAKEILNVVFKLIPLVHNVELKLPKIKITEMSYNSQEKMCSNYFYPEKINVL